MKFLHVIRSLDPRMGGPNETLRQIIQPMREAGYETEVVTLDRPNAPWLRELPIPIHALGPARGWYGFSPRLVPWLRQHHRGYGAVIVRGLWQYHGLGTWIVLRNSSIPYFVFAHGMLDPWGKRHPAKHVKKWAYWAWVEHRVLQRARAVLFTSEEERFLAHGVFWPHKCNEVVVNYGTSPPPGNAEEHRAKFFGVYPALQNKRLVLCLGRIHPKKGCDLLIEAFARVFGADGDWHLVIAGPDEVGTQQKLVRLAKSLGISHRVTWTGMLTGDLKWGAMYVSEVFALASHSENFGIVVAEALACGLPVLISNRVNIWREIAADRAGLVAEDNVNGAEGLLRDWIRLDPLERGAMRENARTCFARRFHIEHAAASLIKAITDSQVCRAAAS